MKSLSELEQMKKKAKSDMAARSIAGRKIIVGMGTSGIASGARDIMTAIINDLHKREISDVTVLLSGFLGNPELEPIVEVIDTDGHKTVYTHVDQLTAKAIVADHIVNGNVCSDAVQLSGDTKQTC